MSLPYQSILEGMSNGALCVSSRGEVLLCNAAAARMLNADAASLAGKPVHELFLLEESSENTEFFQTLLDAATDPNQAHQRKVSLRRGDGTQLFLLVRSERVPHGDSFLVTITLQDVTELEGLRRTEQEQRRQIEEAYQRLQKTQSEARRKWITIAAASVLLAGALLAVWRGGGRKESTAVETGKKTAGEAGGRSTAAIRQKAVSVPLHLSGRLEPLNTVSIVAPFGGRITKRHVQYGQQVERDEVLLELDPAELELQRRQEEARAIKARLAHQEVVGWVEGMEMARSARSLARATNVLATSERRVAEAEALFAKGIIPASELNDLKTQLENHRMEWEAALDEMKAVRKRGDTNNLHVARLELESAEANLRRLTERIEAHVVRAPVGGVVIRPPETTGDSKKTPSMEVGTMAAENEALLAIGDTSGLSLRVRVDEVDWLKIVPGMEARVTGDAFPGITLTGRVASLSSHAKTEAGSKPMFEALIEIASLAPDHAKAVRLGMSATASVLIYNKPDALMVPIKAVKLERDEGASVEVREAGGGVRPVAVEVGPTTLDEVEISSPSLKAGDEVLLP